MKLSESDIQKYQEIYLEKYKKEISKDMAYTELSALINFIQTIINKK